MRRRDAMAVLGAAALAALPLDVLAQPADRVRRLGMLLGTDERGIAAFVQRLSELGWTDGQNLQIESRRAAGDVERLRTHAAELIGLRPDVIMGQSTPGMAALQRETRTIPIVFVMLADPVGTGLVESLARPGGNITGFTTFEPSMGGKWLEVLKEIAPHVRRVAVILHPNTPPNVAFLRAIEAAAPSFAVDVTAAGVSDAAGIERAITALAGHATGGLIVLPHIINMMNRNLIAELAARFRLPAVYALREFVAAGGLMSYGIDALAVWRQAAGYVDRILRGATPSELPVQAPIKFELVINLKAARALDMAIPRSLLLRADEMIE